MTAKLRRFGPLMLFAVAACAGVNPFTSARFASNLAGSGAGGGTTPPPAGSIASTCDLTADRKFIQSFNLRNQSTRQIQYRLTMIASAGPGGFVCDLDRDSYLNAGYRPLAVDPLTFTATIGCDPVPLRGGTQLLALTLSGSIVANTGDLDDFEGAPAAAAPLNGSVRIPVPQLIVFGDGTANFICRGNDACTQAGLIYTTDFGTLVTRITALRTQGTLCNTRVSSVPEWLLFDPNQDDENSSAFHYTTGSFISAGVLNRADNTDPNVNQAVWQVISADGVTLRTFQP